MSRPDRLTLAVNEAYLLFWEELELRYPECNSRAFDANSEGELRAAMQKAAERWLELVKPASGLKPCRLSKALRQEAIELVTDDIADFIEQSRARDIADHGVRSANSMSDEELVRYISHTDTDKASKFQEEVARAELDDIITKE